MLLKRLFFGFWILGILLSTDALAQLRYQKKIRPVQDGFDISANSITNAPGGGYLLGGSMLSFERDEFSLLIIRVDREGGVLWQKQFNTGLWESCRDLLTTPSGEFLIVGNRMAESDRINGMIIKTDPNGNTRWSKEFQQGLSTYLNAVDITHDNQFIIAGTIYYENDLTDMLIMKVSSSGSLLWSVAYGDSASFEEAVDIIQTGKDEYTILGNVREGVSNKSDVLMLKLDSRGNFIWSETYGNHNVDRAQAFQRTPDKGYVIAGHTALKSEKYPDIFLMKTNEHGEESWTRVFMAPYRDDVHHIELASDGGFILSGVAKGLGDTTKQEYFVMKTSEYGGIKWVTGTKNNNYFVEQSGMIPTEHGGWMMAGSKRSVTDDEGTQIFLVKTDSLGLTSCNDRTHFKERDGFFRGEEIRKRLRVVNGFRNLPLASSTTPMKLGTCECSDLKSAFFDYIILGDTVLFYNYFVDGDQYLWTFGDGRQEKIKHYSFVNNSLFHIYNGPGIYKACLDIQNRCSAVKRCEEVEIKARIKDPNPKIDLREEPQLAKYAANTPLVDKPPDLENIKVWVYPNPFLYQTVISLQRTNGFKEKKIKLKLVNVDGEEVELYTRVEEPNEMQVEIHLQREGLPAGIYFFTVQEGWKKIATGKLMVQ